MEKKEMRCEACGDTMKSPYSYMDEHGNWRYVHKRCYISPNEEKEKVTLIDILQDTSGKEYKISKPSCKENTLAYEMWLGFSVRNHRGAIVCTYTSGAPVKVGSIVPLYGIVFKSEWKEVKPWV